MIEAGLTIAVLAVALDSWRRVIRLEGIMKHCKYCQSEEVKEDGHSDA